MLTDRTILVTGGAGFIGSHITDALADRNTVRVLDDFSTGRRANLPDGVEVIEGDIRHDATLQTAMADVEYVFHHAAMVSVEQSVSSPRECHDINSAGTVSVLDHARREDARVIVPSSAAIYGTPDSVPITEPAAKRPSSPYGISKLATDWYARRYAELYDLPTVVLRYFNVYGPRQRHGAYSGVISIFLEQARTGGPITVEGDGSQTRDFVAVEDVVQANLLAAETDSTGEAYNIGTGEQTSIRRLATVVQRVAGTEASITYEEGRTGDIPRSCADIEKARQQLDFQPTVSLRAGLASLYSLDLSGQ